MSSSSRDNLIDACKGGLRLSEHRTKLAEIDAKLATTRAKRAELVEGIKEAQRHLESNGVPHGVSDADVVAEVAEYELATGARVTGVQS